MEKTHRCHVWIGHYNGCPITIEYPAGDIHKRDELIMRHLYHNTPMGLFSTLDPSTPWEGYGTLTIHVSPPIDDGEE